jgi:predicted alpha-1,6-mannanase (GH76 family)
MPEGAIIPGGFQGGTVAEYAAAAVAGLQSWYSERTGLWTIPGGGPSGPHDAGWWNSANALYALIDYMSLTGTRGHGHVLGTTFSRHEWSGFLNQFYDDEGWWALAWINAHDLAHGEIGKLEYLAMARHIFANMEHGWDERTSGGGVIWRKDTAGKNSIENELFLAVAARLHARTPDLEVLEREHYRHWLRKAGQWFYDTFIVADPRHLIYDGLAAGGGYAGHEQTFTYTQGVILGALVDMAASKIDIAGRDPLPLATRIADAVLASPTLARDGILTEIREPAAGDMDLPQFKGIFMRNLAYLAAHVGAPGNARYVAFIRRTAGSLLASSRNSINQFGFRWQGPFDGPDSVRQSSGLEALNAALRVGIAVASV